MSIRVDPVIPGSDWLSADQDVEGCPVCNPEGSTQDYLDLSDEIQDKIPYWLARAVGGFDPDYLLFERYDDGELVRVVLMDHSVMPFSSWESPNPFADCPVCNGWGLFSDNGHVQMCIGCQGQSVKEHAAFDPLYAYWERQLVPGVNIYMQRGRPDTTPLSTDEIVHTLEKLPGMTRIN